MQIKPGDKVIVEFSSFAVTGVVRGTVAAVTNLLGNMHLSLCEYNGVITVSPDRVRLAGSSLLVRKFREKLNGGQTEDKKRYIERGAEVP